MKLRNDIMKMYTEVHSWVGIFSGLLLFIAFYAGALTMFEEPLQRWASPPVALPEPVPLERAPELVEKLVAAHPEAARRYSINVHIDGNRPARVSWSTGERSNLITSYAALNDDGELAVSRQSPSPVAEFIDMIHQKVGLPVPRQVAMPVMGTVAFLYAIAIVSGVFVLLPTLAKDLFALRLQKKNLKRMWLDVHNVLGLFSLPFHAVMAVTSVGFAFFPYWYQSQQAAFGYHIIEDEHAIHGSGPMLTPEALIARVEAQAPGFKVAEIMYAREPDGGLETHVAGPFPGRAVRGGHEATADVDAWTGRFTDASFMPGLRSYAGGFASNFISTHFGNFGGDPVRFAYLLLGLGGAALFYTGNLLWIEARRRRERKEGKAEQTRSSYVMGALTVGTSLGCVAGLSLTIAAAKLLGASATTEMHSAIYYAVFVAFTLYALIRGAARSGIELAGAAAFATLGIPVVSLFSGASWYQNGASVLVDVGAVCIAAALLFAMRSAKRRVATGPRDSIWAAPVTR